MQSGLHANVTDTGTEHKKGEIKYCVRFVYGSAEVAADCNLFVCQPEGKQLRQFQNHA